MPATSRAPMAPRAAAQQATQTALDNGSARAAMRPLLHSLPRTAR